MTARSNPGGIVMKFSASKALSESFAIFTGRFTAMLPIAVIFTLVPVAIFTFVIGTKFAGLSQNPGDPRAALQTILAMAGSFALVFIAYELVRAAGMCALCIAAATRQSVSLGEAIGEGFRAMLPLIGVYLVLLVGYIALGAVLMLTVGLSMMRAFTAAAAGGQAPGAGSVGMMILVIAVILIALFYVMVKLALIIPVIAVDKERGPFAAIRRSWTLTRGASFKIFLLFLLTGFAAALISGVLNAFSGGMQLTAPNPTGSALWSQIAVSAITGTVFGMYFISLIVAIHAQLAGPSASAISETFE
jgi:membrane-anchored glycerophosphoryl diester phosphodiesterase (GDPDase)